MGTTGTQGVRNGRTASGRCRLLRFFTSPGVGHWGGPGADDVDLMGALEAWVEDGKVPKDLIASKLDDQDKVLFTGPLCEYPAFPRYDGKSDPNKASSFSCETH